jgi:hypothetical protein
MSATLPKPWISYAPAIFISVSVLGTVALFSGTMAAAITAFAVLPSLVATVIVTFVIRINYKPATTITAVGLGFGLCVATAIAVLVGLHLLGPSQIM